MENKIILPPLPIGIYTANPSMEPQMIQKRASNQAFIYLDSVTPKLELDKTKMLMSTIENNSDQANTLIYGITRIKVRSCGLNFVTPNLNIKNNSVIFYSSNMPLTPWEAIIAPGQYDTANSLMDALITSLNTLTVGSGLTFSYNASIYGDRIYTLSSAGGNYYFDPNCKMVKYGFQLINLPVDNTFTSSKIVGYVGLLYTRWVDICSTTLNKDVKIRNIANNNVSDIVYRFYIDPPGQGFQYSTQPNIAAFNIYNQEPINIIDFQLYDEFGEQLYIPDVNNQLGFWWNLTFLVEL